MRWMLVPLARDSLLQAVHEADVALLDPAVPWTSRVEAHDRLGQVRVRRAGVEGTRVPEGQHGRSPVRMNFVAAEERDAHGRPLREPNGTQRGRLHYATPTAGTWGCGPPTSTRPSPSSAA